MRHLLLLTLLVGCNHSQPFRSDPGAPDGPKDATIPRRLTFSAGVDQTPSWLPDGAGLLYSFERLERPDQDSCIGELPAAGGNRMRSLCHRGPSETDSIDALEWPASNGVGDLAYLRSSVAVGPVGPTSRAIVVATLSSTDTGRVVREFPFIASSGKDYAAVTHLQWLRQGELLFVAAQVANVSPTSQPDIVISGLEIARLSVNHPAEPVVVPGTDYASSVWPSDDGASIYYTLGGDSRVFQREVASGEVSVVHNFAPLGIARDVSVRGSDLVAIVGGDVSFSVHPLFGPIQSDAGGTLRHVDLTTDEETLLESPAGLVRHASLSPDGTHIVAEVSSAQGSAPDLWLFEIP